MTDDLFEDFDLKSSADSKKDEVVSNEAAEINSQDMHPDIFSAENDAENMDLSDDEIRHLADKIEESLPPAQNVFSDAETRLLFAGDENKENTDVQVEPEIEVRTIDKVRRPDIALDYDNFGITLRRLREESCLSIRNLAEELRIKESFLTALENEDYDSLPPEVYIVAYIRRLGAIYHLTDSEIVALSAKVRARMEVELPEDMDKVVAIYEPSEENENKLRHIYMFFAAVLAIALILTAAGIYFFAVSRKESSRVVPNIAPVEHFSSDMLIKLQPEVKLDAPVLKITR